MACELIRFMIGIIFISLAATVVMSKSTPEIIVNNVIYDNGDTVTLFYDVFTANSRASVDCMGPDQGGQVESKTLQCYGSRPTIQATVINYNKTANGKNCTCYVRYASGAYSEMSTVFLNVEYIPETEPVVTIEGKYIQPFETYIHHVNKSTVDISCKVKDGNPGISNYTINCDQRESITVAPNFIVIEFVYDTGTIYCTCVPAEVTGLYKRTVIFLIDYIVQPYTPQTPPYISIDYRNMNDGKTVPMNADLTVQCGVREGNPAVYEVTFRCGSLLMATKQYMWMNVTIPYNKTYNQQTCVCTGKHISGKYNLNTTIVLNVTYAASVTSLKVNGVEGFLNVSNTSVVELLCQADGNPAPNVTIQSLNTGTLLYSGKGLTARRNLTITTQTYGVYVCTASNYLNDQTKLESRYVEIGFVKSSAPIIASFTANGGADLLNIRKQTVVTFTCQPVGGVGSVTWSVRARKGSCTPSLYSAPGLVKTYQLTAACGCTDIYECVAQAPGFVNDVRSVNVQVDCTDYPPDSPPVIVVYNKTITDGEEVKLDPSGREVNVLCRVEGGDPQVSNVTMTCGNDIYTATGNRKLFTLNYSTSASAMTCVCTAGHVTGLYTKNTLFSLKLESTALIANFTANGVSSTLNVKANAIFRLQCSPYESIANTEWTLIANSSGTLLQGLSKNVSSGVSLAIPCVEDETYECIAKQPNLMTETKSMKVVCVKEPPERPPVIVVYNKTVTDGQTVKLSPSSNIVNIQCQVDGGEPRVSSVTLTCEHIVQTATTYTQTFAVPYNTSVTGRTCVCTASHVTGRYNMSTTFSLSLEGTQATKQLKNSGVNVRTWNVLEYAVLVLLYVTLTWPTE
ncbi:uncharacterized protein LOC131948906 [Physella acuta]|uniref:uncharacterized protein LOC131948906 n=1 Tax=Physella acuta TaxID=109671 RepID=UPI0027DC284F|nr:uncharacterized protein LOC131948906 [Physella acuta]